MKKKFMKTTIAILALFAMLAQNTYGVYAAMEGVDLPEQPTIVVEQEQEEVAIDNSQDEESASSEETSVEEASSAEEISVAEELPDSNIVVDSEESDEQSSEQQETDVNYDDEIMPICDDIALDDLAEEEVVISEPVDSNIDILSDQISGTNLDSVSVAINTDKLNSEDSFRIIFTGAVSAKYDTLLNDTLYSSAHGTYTFDELNKEGFNIRAVSDMDVSFVYSSENGIPVISAVSKDLNAVGKELTTKVVTLAEGSPVTAVYGKGFENVNIDLNTEELDDKASYALVVNTDAEATVNGNRVEGRISGLTKATTNVAIDNLAGNEFTAYVVSEADGYFAFEIASTDESAGTASIRLLGETEGRRTVYTYEDDNVSVIATLSDPKAIPDNAEFRVTPITSRNAVSTYLEALNNNADAEESEFTEENTLLYDVAFLIDKVDEDGNVVPGVKVEIEPEDGTVKIDIVFKKAQISEDMGVQSDEEVSVYHLPLTDSIKENVDKTIDATLFDASEVKVEEVKADVDVETEGEDSVSLSLSDLSAIALKTNGTNSFEKGTARTYADMLGSAKNIGVVANDITLAGHLETNIAAGSLHGIGPLQGPRNGGQNGVSYIGAYDGSELIIDKNASGGKMLVYTTEAAARNFGSNTLVFANGTMEYKRNSFVVDFSLTQSQIASKVSSMISDVASNSAAAFREDKAYKFDGTNKTIDLTKKSDGTYYINCVAGKFTTNGLNIKIKENQNIIFNIPDTSVAFGQYYCQIVKADGTDLYKNSTQASTDDDPVCQRIIFNCPNATYAQTNGVSAGTYIVPYAEFDTNSVAAGWLVAKKINKIGGQEWHCVFHDMPDPFYNPASIKFSVEKTIENIVIDDRNYAPTFTFELYETGSQFYTGQTGINNGTVKLIDTKTISAFTNNKGTVDFKTIDYDTYKTEGTYHRYYVIKEPKVDGWKADDSQRDDNGDAYAHIDVEITVTKTMEGNKPIYTTTVSNVKYSYKLEGRSIIGNNTLNTSNPTIGFTNKRDGGQPVKHAFEATKSFIGGLGNWPDGKSFSFRLEPLDSTTCGSDNWVSGRAPMPSTVPDGVTVEYNTDGSVKYYEATVSKDTPDLRAYFGEVTYPYDNPEGEHTEPSTEQNGERCRFYMYKLYEVIPEGATALNGYIYEGIQYDPHVQFIKVIINQIYNDGNGNRIATKTVHGSTSNKYCDGNINEIKFENAKIGDTSITIEGKKTITPTNYTLAKDTVKFEITADKAKAPMPVNTVVGNEEDLTFSFGEIKYTTADIGETYVYTVKEQTGSVVGMSYSHEEYTVTVAITKEGNSVKAAKTITKKTVGNVNEISFTNTFEATGSATFEAKKVYNRPLNGNEFTFELYKADNAAGTGAVKVATGKNKSDAENGKIEFIALNTTSVYTDTYNYSDIGKTYYYFAKEIAGDTASTGITYSSAEYVYTVTINGVSSTLPAINGKAQLDITKTVTTKAGSAVSGTPEFENTYNAEGKGSFSVAKVFTGTTNAPDSVKNKTFTFKATLVNAVDTNGAAITATYEKEVSLKGGETKNFEEVTFNKAGTYTFNVQETNIPAGATEANNYTYEGIHYDNSIHTVVITLVDNGNGSLSISSKTIDGADDATKSAPVSITNTYTTEDISAYLEGVKTLSNKTLTAGQFTFEITAKNGAPAPAVTTVTNGADDTTNKIKFGPMTYTAPGVYEYDIKETSTDGNGITVDTKTVTAKVTVTDNGTGQLQKSIEYFNGTSSLGTSFSFDNTYSASGSAIIKASKELISNVKVLKDGQFDFELCDSSRNRLSGAGYFKSNNGSGTVEFAPIAYTLDDVGHTYTYYIHEVVTTKVKGFTYDTDYHKVTVEVKDNKDGTISADVTYGEAGESSLTIKNYYDASGEAEITGVKEMLGRKIGASEVITISLTPKTEGDSNKAMTTQVVRDALDHKKGTFKFTGLTYTKPGTYEYEIAEVKGSDSTVTYSTEKYIATVVVTDAATTEASSDYGKLDTAVTYKLIGGSSVTNPSFTNVVTASNEFQPYAIKTLTNGTLKAKQFNFILTDESGNTEPANNDGSGLITFAKRTYNAAGTHTYIIEEVCGTDGTNGIKKYDRTKYKIVVELTESETATLNKTVSYYRKLVTDTDYVLQQDFSCAKFIFNNEYAATGSVKIEAKKELSPVALQAGEFKFELVDAATGSVIETIGNISDGSIAFSEITYNQGHMKGLEETDYYYIIREKNEGNQGYSYDDTQYVVKVHLKDKGDGTIDTSKTIDKATGKLEDVSKFSEWISNLFKGEGVPAKFSNTYTANGQLVLSGTKTYDGGKALQPEMFEFNIVRSDGEYSRSVKNTGTDGKTIAFAPIQYTLDDVGKTYTYTISETNGGQTKENDGIKYCSQTYTLTVTVKDDERDGKLELTAKVGNADKELTFTTEDDKKTVNGVEVSTQNFIYSLGGFDFKNEYETKPVSITLGGTKVILPADKNIADYEGQFTFTMTGPKTSNLSSTYSSTATNAADGTYSFDAIEFTRKDLENADGTYALSKDFVYTVKESKNDTTATDIVFDADAVSGKTITVRLTDNNDGTLSATALNTASPLAAVSFTNTVIADGQLVISVKKDVTGTNATDKEFLFTLSDGTNTDTFGLYKNQVKTIVNRTFTLADVKNADGTYKTYSVDYTVTENENNHKGYQNDTVATHTVHADVTYNASTNNLDIETTVDGKAATNDTVINFTYTNKYSAKGSIDVSGTKVLTGRDLNEGEFWFEISGDKPFETAQITRNTLKADGTGSFEFASIDCFDNSDIGKTYVYTVREIKKADGAETDDIPNVTYDGTIYEVTAAITDNGDGTLKVTKAIKNVTKAQTVNTIGFNNVFESSDKVGFVATKTLENHVLENMFSFVLHEVKGNKLAEDEVIVNNGADVVFSEIAFDQTDVNKEFVYEISEKAGDYKAYSYSKVKYYAKVDVSIQGNKVVASETYYSDKELTKALPEGTAPNFENTYKSDVQVNLAGTKVLKGFDKIKDKGTYTFQLKDSTGAVIDEYSVNGEGTFKFPSKTGKTYEGTEKKILYFDQDDMKGPNNTYLTERTFEYTVSEKNGGLTINGVTYADTVYKVTVVVSYDEKTKELKAVTSVNPSIDPTKLVFTNIYTADGEKPLSGIKTIEGKNLADQAYTFTLSAMKDGKEVELTSVKNNGAAFIFMPGKDAKSGITYLKYTQEDIGSTFEYIVRETLTTDGSVKDETVYTVTDVIGKDDTTGKLTIARTIKGSNDSSELKFNNTYAAEGEIILDGIKTMKNKELLGKEFSFVLKDSNGNIVKDEKGNEYRVYNDAAGLDTNNEAKIAFKFPAIKFTQKDLSIVDSNGNTTYTNEKTFYYEVVEEGKLAGVTNGGEIYTVAITVKDSGKNDGKLIVEKVVTSDTSSDAEGQTFLEKLMARIKNAVGKAVSEVINFVNTYAAKGEWGVDGTKTMKGRELEFSGFTFRLSELTSPTGKVVTDKVNDKEVARTVEVTNTKTDAYTGPVKFTKKDAKWLEYSIDDIGTHYYKVEEIEPENKKTTDNYDKSVYIYTVDVTDNGDGTLKSEVKAVTKDGSAVALADNRFSFVNTYEAKGKIGFDGTKKMEGRELLDDKYTFTITDVATGETAKVQNDSEGKISFTDAISFLNYTKTGTYQYIISEDDFTSECVTKDTNKYRITVVVKEQEVDGKPVYNGVLDASIVGVEVLNQNGDWTQKTDYDKVSYFTFTNVYSAEADLNLVGKKHLKRYAQELESKEINATQSIDGQFTFLLKKYETEDRTATGKIVWEKNTTCKADGSYSFDVEKYTTESLKNPASKTGYDSKKTFYYTVEEKNDAKAGITYDTRVYSFNVTVEMVANSSKLKVTVTDANGKAIDAVEGTNNTYSIAGYDFTNIKPEFTSVQGTKTWVDNVKDASSRPDVKINLYATSNGIKKLVDSTVIKAPNTSYSFTNLPVVDENGYSITYSVTEDKVDGYASEQNGFNFTNTAGDIQIRKNDEVSGLALAGAKLAILDESGNTIETWTTGGSAHVVEAALTPGKTYILRELEAPKGYAKAPDKKFTVPTDGSNITVTMEDPRIIGQVKLHKLDSETRSALAGAEFALYDENGERIYATGSAGEYTYSSDAVNGRFAVNGSGELTIKELPYGNYYFIEITAPSGYSLSSEKKSFSIKDEDETVEVTMLNTKEVGSVRLRKTNADGSRTLAGAVFELYAKTPSSISSAIASTIYKDAYFRVGSYTTDSSGMIYVDNLPWDDYYFVEVQAPSGYEINKDTNGDPIVYTFTIGSSGTASVSYDLGTITNNPIPDEPVPPVVPETPSVLGERTPKVDDGRRTGGVLSGVLGVRAAPKQGVLGERIGPVTGDAANIALWLLLIVACAAAIIGTAIAGKKRAKRLAKK